MPAELIDAGNVIKSFMHHKQNQTPWGVLFMK